jgi:hypothetical protein
MKTKQFFIAALLFASVSVGAVAKEDPSNIAFAVVPVKGSDVFKVIYKNEGESRVKLNLYNAAGELIFSENISNNKFIRPLNLSGLKAGEYTVVVSEGSSRVSETFSYKVPASEVSIASDKIVHVSKVKGEDQRFVLTIANAKNENFVINIYGQNESLVYTESAEVNGSTAKLFNVKNGKVSKIEVVDAAGVKSTKNF